MTHSRAGGGTDAERHLGMFELTIFVMGFARGLGEWQGTTCVGEVALLARHVHTCWMFMTSPTNHSGLASKPRHGSRAFTLAELMAVVAIIGILATIAAVGYRKYINSARASEAVWMVNGIRAAQEAYRAETLTYLNVSGSLNVYYPTNDVGAKKVPWDGTGAIHDKWRILNVATDGSVLYGYATVAGSPGTITVTGSAFTIDFPEAVEPWYVVQAKGDIDGDGDPSYYLATSFSNEVYWQNEGE